MNKTSDAIELAEKQLADSRRELVAKYHAARDNIKHVVKSPVTISTAVIGATALGYLAYQKYRGSRLRPATARHASPLSGISQLVRVANTLIPLLSAAGVLKASQAVQQEHAPVIAAAPPARLQTDKTDRYDRPGDAGSNGGTGSSSSAAKTGSSASKVAGSSESGGKLAQGWSMTKAAVSSWLDDFAPSMGAALSYYTLFSLAPMLIIVIAVAGLIFGQEAAQGEIVAQLRGLMGNEGALAVQGLLKSVSQPGKGAIATVIGVVTLLIGATAVFAELQSALDRIWHVPATKKESGLWNLIHTRLLSFGMVLGLGFMLLVSLVVSAALAALGNWWGGFFGDWETVLQVLNFVVSFGVVTGMFAMIYKFMPSAKIPWRDVWIGAAVTALLFTIGKFLIGLYLGKSDIASGFGAAGSLVILLVWVYYSAQIFLLGAEFTWVYSHRHGSRMGTPQTAAQDVPMRPAGRAEATRTDSRRAWPLPA